MIQKITINEHRVGSTQSYANHELAPWDDDKDGPSGEGQGQGQGQGKGKDQGEGEGEGEGKGGGKGGRRRATFDPDKVFKRTQEIADKRVPTAQIDGPDGRDPSGQAGQPGTAELGDLTSREDEINKIKRTKRWEELLDIMFSSAAEDIYRNWSVPSRKTIQQLPSVSKTGGIAIQPKEVIFDENILKVCLVLDTSGSMYYLIPKVLAEAESLLAKIDKTNDAIAVFYFSGTHQMYRINLAANEYAKMETVQDYFKPPKGPQKKNWRSLLKRADTGGTVFSGAIIDDISTLASNGYNVMVFSDEDIIGSQNLKSLRHLYDLYGDRFYYCAPNLNIFRNIIKAFFNNKKVPHNFTHL
jgi:hypothetical protein